MTSGAPIFAPRRAAVNSPQRHRHPGNNPQLLAGDGLLPTPCPPCLHGKDSCATKPIRRGVSSGKFEVSSQHSPEPRNRCAKQDAPDKSRDQPNRSSIFAQQGGSESDSGTFVAGVKQSQFGRASSAGIPPDLKSKSLCTNKANWAKGSGIGRQGSANCPPIPVPGPWTFVRNKANLSGDVLSGKCRTERDI